MKSRSVKLTTVGVIIILLITVVVVLLSRQSKDSSVNQTTTASSLDSLPAFVKATPSISKVSSLENKTLADMKKAATNYGILQADFDKMADIHKANVKALNRTNLSETDFHTATDYANKLDTYLKYLRAYATKYSEQSKLAKKNSDDFTRNSINQKNIDAKNQYLDSKQDWLSAYSKIMSGN